ncbi:unnamed protein product [Nippostrongylus brasiliensis]|uniref:3-isopropylmalate dehydratase small subunit n=1 Tax=Nippostrongylus brasiliensis TaxID=27835 RepID=A0A0N4XQZ5_NIPBR|nr:unnamed protein product [Nippostrongylus brasiliensis]
MIIIAKFQRIHNRRNGIVVDPQVTRVFLSPSR